MSCGSCNMCCTVISVPDIGKPAGMRCWATTVHGGCSEQYKKGNPEFPEMDACATWECVWRNTQNESPELRLPRGLRPNVCHVMIGPAESTEPNAIVAVHVDPKFPNAWKEPGIREYLHQTILAGARYVIHLNGNQFPINEHSF